MAADKRQAKIAKKAVEKIQLYKKIFSGPDGALVLEDLMAAHGMMGPTYNGNVRDMLIKEGERQVVLRILKYLNVNERQLLERIEAHEQALAE